MTPMEYRTFREDQQGVEVRIASARQGRQHGALFAGGITSDVAAAEFPEVQFQQMNGPAMHAELFLHEQLD